MIMKDYQVRMWKEYRDLRDKYKKLHRMIVKAEAGTLDFTLNCPLELLKEQANYMGNYLRILEIRAEIEKINLFEGLPDENPETEDRKN